MKKYLLFILFISAISCEKKTDTVNNMSVNIINKSEVKIDSVIINTQTLDLSLCDTLIIKDIKVDTNKSNDWLAIKTCEGSGTYLINAYLNDTVLTANAGRFTDSKTLDFLMYITVHNTSVLPGFGREE